MVFDPDASALACPHCQSTVLIEKDHRAIVRYEFDPLQVDCRDGEMVRSARCDNCGSYLDPGVNIVSQTCPFCGSARIVPIQTFLGVTPRSLIPFRISRVRALEILTKWVDQAVPFSLKGEYRTNGMYGMYVPYWSYSVVINADSSTKGFSTEAGGSRFVNYSEVIVPATRYMDEELLHAIEPYILIELVPYRSEYLAGFRSEYHSIGLHNGWESARKIILKCQDESIFSEAGSQLDINALSENISYRHFLLPVWVHTYPYHGKTYETLINGQTGVIHGRMPYTD